MSAEDDLRAKVADALGTCRDYDVSQEYINGAAHRIIALVRAADAGARKDAENKGFTLGIAVAVGDIMNRGQDTIAKELLDCAGVTLKQVMDADATDYDIAAVREALKS